MLDIEKIEFQLSLGVFHRRSVLVLHLRPAGYSRTHRVPLCKKWKLLFQQFAEIRLLRTRSNQTHFSVQDVEKLRQLIKAILTNEVADGRDSAISVSGPAWPALFRVLPHGTEFHDLKNFAVPPHALLLEQD